MRAIRNVHSMYAGRPEGMRPLGKPWRRWEDNIKMGVTEIWWNVWAGCIWLRIGPVGAVMNTVMNFRVP
jgi:hypothetical protein